MFDVARKRKGDAIFHDHLGISRLRKREREFAYSGLFVVCDPVPHKIKEDLSLHLSACVDVDEETRVEVDGLGGTPKVAPTPGEKSGSCCFFEGQEGDYGDEEGLG